MKFNFVSKQGLPEEKVFASHFEFLLNYGHAVTEARRQEAELAAKDTLLIDRRMFVVIIIDD